jgi:hypothetical protein
LQDALKHATGPAMLLVLLLLLLLLQRFTSFLTS